LNSTCTPVNESALSPIRNAVRNNSSSINSIVSKDSNNIIRQKSKLKKRNNSEKP
jgi:hypothetical protein